MVYIGRTVSMDNRVAQHKTEQPFIDFCKSKKIKYEDFMIEYIVLANATEEDVVEKILINKIKPLINVKDKHDSISDVITININCDWIKYEYPDNKSNDLKGRHILCRLDETNLKNEIKEMINKYLAILTLETMIELYPEASELYIEDGNKILHHAVMGILDNTFYFIGKNGRLNAAFRSFFPDSDVEIDGKKTKITLGRTVLSIKDYIPAMKYSYNTYRSHIQETIGYSDEYNGVKRLENWFEKNQEENWFPLFKTDYTDEDARAWNNRRVRCLACEGNDKTERACLGEDDADCR